MKRFWAGLTANTFLLALASLFSDVASEMLYPVLPGFLSQTLGVAPSIVGLIEGVATAVQNIMQGVSGWLSDKLRRRKSIAVVGFLLSTVGKLLIGFALAWPAVLGARALDRFGAGTRSAPRDALVAASVAVEDRGKAFGLESLGDNLGAFFGPLVALALVLLLQVDQRSIFFLTVIPGSIALVLVLLVRERPRAPSGTTKVDLLLPDYPRKYWHYLGVIALLGLGNSSNAFLILRTQALGASLTTTILIYASYNLVAALVSYPAGYLSDRVGRHTLLLLAFAVFALVYLGFALAARVWVMGVLFVLYGVYQGIFRTVGKATAIDPLPAELHASGVGMFTTTAGVTGLIANVVGGQLWTHVAPEATFLYGAACALAGIMGMLVLRAMAR